MSKNEKIMIKNNFIQKNWARKINAKLKKMKSENITRTNKSIKAWEIFVERKAGLKSNQRRENASKVPWLKIKIQQSL